MSKLVLYVSFIFMSLFVCMLPNTLLASDYATGREAAISGNYEEAIKIWEKLVLEGDVLATYSLAQIYQNGLGVLRDYEKARTLFHVAALLGYPDAQYSLGAHYLSLAGASMGNEIKSNTAMDIVKGYTWLSIAAKNGHADAPELLNQLETRLPTQLVLDAQAHANTCKDNLIQC